jgi:hypothetical protein
VGSGARFRFWRGTGASGCCGWCGISSSSSSSPRRIRLQPSIKPWPTRSPTWWFWFCAPRRRAFHRMWWLTPLLRHGQGCLRTVRHPRTGSVQPHSAHVVLHHMCPPGTWCFDPEPQYLVSHTAHTAIVTVRAVCAPSGTRAPGPCSAMR